MPGIRVSRTTLGQIRVDLRAARQPVLRVGVSRANATTARATRDAQQRGTMEMGGHGGVLTNRRPGLARRSGTLTSARGARKSARAPRGVCLGARLRFSGSTTVMSSKSPCVTSARPFAAPHRRAQGRFLALYRTAAPGRRCCRAGFSWEPLTRFCGAGLKRTIPMSSLALTVSRNRFAWTNGLLSIDTIGERTSIVLITE